MLSCSRDIQDTWIQWKTIRYLGSWDMFLWVINRRSTVLRKSLRGSQEEYSRERVKQIFIYFYIQYGGDALEMV